MRHDLVRSPERILLVLMLLKLTLFTAEHVGETKTGLSGSLASAGDCLSNSSSVGATGFNEHLR